MDEDPIHLKHPGDLAALKNALGCWFYQGALDNSSDLPSVVQQVRESHSAEGRRLLYTQIETLLTRSDEEIIAIWDSHTSYILSAPSDARLLFKMLAAALGDVDQGDRPKP